MTESAALIPVAGAVFMAPFLFLSALGGEVADRFDTAQMAEKLNLAEIAAAGVSVSGRALSSVPGLMVSWFWLIGAIILPILPTMVKEVLGGSEIIVTSYLTIFAVALGAGRCFNVSRC